MSIWKTPHGRAAAGSRDPRCAATTRLDHLPACHLRCTCARPNKPYSAGPEAHTTRCSLLPRAFLHSTNHQQHNAAIVCLKHDCLTACLPACLPRAPAFLFCLIPTSGRSTGATHLCQFVPGSPHISLPTRHNPHTKARPQAAHQRPSLHQSHECPRAATHHTTAPCPQSSLRACGELYMCVCANIGQQKQKPANCMLAAAPAAAQC